MVATGTANYSISLKKGWLEMLASERHSTLESTTLLQVAAWNNDGTTQK